MTTLIFDTTNLFMRNYAACPQSDMNGNPAGGVIGSIRSIKWLISETKADQVFCVWDAAGGSSKRRSILSDYKAGRKPHMNRAVDENVKDGQENFIWQLDKTQQLLSLIGITQITAQDIEADDAIAYLVGMLDPSPKVVVSSDKDMWQLISDTTMVYWPVKKTYITPGTFNEHSPFINSNYVLARAISGKGDSSDNIHGISGLGENTILKIFPMLAKSPTTFSELLNYVRDQLGRNEKGELKIGASEKRWFPIILEQQDLIRRNIELMQLTSPIISATSASLIRRAAQEFKPKFEMTNFKLSLINAGIQITDKDLFTTFQEYRRRVENKQTQSVLS